MADDQQGAAVGRAGNPCSQCLASLSRWLVGSSRRSTSLPGEQDAGQLDPAPFAPGKDPERTIDAIGAQAQSGRRSGEPRTRRRNRPGTRRRLRPGRSGRWLARRAAPPWRSAASPAGWRPRPGPAPTGYGPGRCRRWRAGRPRGSWLRKPSRPCTVTVPAVAGTSPPSTLSRLVLPAPLRPTRPTLSPARTRNDASSNVRRPPTSTLSWRASSTPP